MNSIKQYLAGKTATFLASTVAMILLFLIGTLLIIFYVFPTRTEPIQSTTITTESHSISNEIINSKVGDVLIIFMCDHTYKTRVIENHPECGTMYIEAVNAPFTCYGDKDEPVDTMFITYERLNEMLLHRTDYRQVESKQTAPVFESERTFSSEKI